MNVTNPLKGHDFAVFPGTDFETVEIEARVSLDVDSRDYTGNVDIRDQWFTPDDLRALRKALKTLEKHLRRAREE